MSCQSTLTPLWAPCMIQPAVQHGLERSWDKKAMHIPDIELTTFDLHALKGLDAIAALLCSLSVALRSKTMLAMVHDFRTKIAKS